MNKKLVDKNIQTIRALNEMLQNKEAFKFLQNREAFKCSALFDSVKLEATTSKDFQTDKPKVSVSLTFTKGPTTQLYPIYSTTKSVDFNDGLKKKIYEIAIAIDNLKFLQETIESM